MAPIREGQTVGFDMVLEPPAFLVRSDGDKVRARRCYRGGERRQRRARQERKSRRSESRRQGTAGDGKRLSTASQPDTGRRCGLNQE
jgi:hypothetical protein